MAFDMTDRLPTLDRKDLVTLRANARRLEGGDGDRADQAAALLPLIEAELERRGPETSTAKKAPAKRKK